MLILQLENNVLRKCRKEKGMNYYHVGTSLFITAERIIQFFKLSPTPANNLFLHFKQVIRSYYNIIYICPAIAVISDQQSLWNFSSEKLAISNASFLFITGNSVTDPFLYSCIINVTGIAYITVLLNVHLNKQRDCPETALGYRKRSRPHFRSKFSSSRLLDRDCFQESRITAAWPAFPYLQKACKKGRCNEGVGFYVIDAADRRILELTESPWRVIIYQLRWYCSKLQLHIRYYEHLENSQLHHTRSYNLPSKKQTHAETYFLVVIAPSY